MRNFLITGGAGFIGANFTHYLLAKYDDIKVVVFDKLTYAGNLDNLLSVDDDPRFVFVHGDITDADAVAMAIRAHGIEVIVNFAAESHVDRSIMNPDAFVKTDVLGTFVLLEAARRFGLERYHQISTDEVYGHVPTGSSKENDPVEPRSPYAASKASADLLVNSYHITYGLPVTMTRGSNNIGPFQYPEKVVPLFVTNALDDIPLPLYGDGLQMRDYQYVEDHCEGIDVVLRKGTIGEVYNVGTGAEMRNIDMTRLILETLGKPTSLIQPVTDRPGHDRRYSLDVSKLRALGWQPRHTCAEAVVKTVHWYHANQWWWRKIKNGEHYREFYQRLYAGRAVKSA